MSLEPVDAARPARHRGVRRALAAARAGGARYAVRYTNLDVLATVVLTLVDAVRPAAILVLGLGALVVGLARPHVERMLLREKATVILVVDTSRSMQAKDVEPTRLGAVRKRFARSSTTHRTTSGSGSSSSAGRRRSRRRRRTTTSSWRRRSRTSTSSSCSAGTAIGDALQTAVLLGRQVTDLVPEEESRPRPARPLATHRSRRPPSPRRTRRRARCRSCSSPTAPRRAASSSLSRAPSWPRTRGSSTRSLSNPGGVIERGPFGGVPQDSGRSSRFHPTRHACAIARVTGGEFSRPARRTP